jgi:hypothetical protein
LRFVSHFRYTNCLIVTLGNKRVQRRSWNNGICGAYEASVIWVK